MLALAACGSDGGARDSGASDGIGTVSDSEGSTSNTGGGDADSDSDTGGDDGTQGGDADSAPAGQFRFDLGSLPDSSIQIEEGCTKVDFLFVIDNSGSMADNQTNLVNNFPNFITGIQNTLTNVDEYQVGVITSDGYSPNVAGCTQLGGLVVETGGNNSSNQTCGPYAAGGNYMTEQDDLTTQFACAARVGTSGSAFEQPMRAVEIAVNKDLGGAGQCNEGFLRDDALLVLVIITDEWDGPGDPDSNASPGDAQSWYNTVVAAKGGIPENVVVVSLVHFGGCPPTDGFLSGDIEPFTNLFGDNGFLGCIADDYGPIFTEAVGIIENACDNFQPPG